MCPRRRAVFTIALAIVCTVARPAAAQVPGSLLHSIPAPPVGLQKDAHLGSSVASDGAYTVVGADWDDLGGIRAGLVKVFDSASGALLHILPNPNPNPSGWSQFGSAVAISGTRVVVGEAYFYSRHAYVFDLSSATPTVPVAILDNPSGDSDHFGSAVAISGTRIVVGAYEHAQYDTPTRARIAGIAYVYDLNSATPTVPVVAIPNPDPGPRSSQSDPIDDSFGYSVGISGTRIVVGAYGENRRGNNSGSAYVYDLNSAMPTVPVVTLHNPNPNFVGFPGGNFGSDVAIAATRIAIAAAGNDTVYVYDLSSTTPTEPIVTIDNPSSGSTQIYGTSVAISGTHIVVGNPFFYSMGMVDVGRAYVYDSSSATPTVPVATLDNPTPLHEDFFGFSVSISGTRVVVGAYSDDTGGYNAGSAYVYELSSATPTVPTATLHHQGPSSRDAFGNSVAISGTLMVVGAWRDETGGPLAGIVYVYDLSAATPDTPIATLRNPSSGYYSFGVSVAISGSRIAVGADRPTATGRVYVYDLSSATPTVPVETLNTPSPNNNFGKSVGIDSTRVVVGVPEEMVGSAQAAGSAYIYDLSSATPTLPVATLRHPSPSFGDLFGTSVAISGTRVVVGAWRDDTPALDAGSAHVYDLSSATPTVPVATLNQPSPLANDYFGYSVAISGTRVVVGSHGADTRALDAGSAYVYDLSSAAPTVPVATLNQPSPVAQDYFGFSVAISGTQVVVGSHADDTGALNAGSAYVYDLSNPTPAVPVATLHNPSPKQDDFFASAVAIDGTTVVIGAPFVDSPQADKGAVYVFGVNSNDIDNDGLLDAWEIAHFGTMVGHAALDDFDGDGRKELIELAFDTDPKFPDAAAGPVVVNEAGYLTVTLTKRAGVTYLGQSAATPASTAFSHTTTTVLIDNATTLKVRDNVPTNAGAQRFLRVQVKAAP